MLVAAGMMAPKPDCLRKLPFVQQVFCDLAIVQIVEIMK